MKESFCAVCFQFAFSDPVFMLLRLALCPRGLYFRDYSGGPLFFGFLLVLVSKKNWLKIEGGI